MLSAVANKFTKSYIPDFTRTNFDICARDAITPTTVIVFVSYVSKFTSSTRTVMSPNGSNVASAIEEYTSPILKVHRECLKKERVDEGIYVCRNCESKQITSKRIKRNQKNIFSAIEPREEELFRNHGCSQSPRLLFSQNTS